MIITSDELLTWLVGLRKATAGTPELLELYDVLEQLDNVIGDRQPIVLPPNKPPSTATPEEALDFLDWELERVLDYDIRAAWDTISLRKAERPDDMAIDSAIRGWMDDQLLKTETADEHDVVESLNDLSWTLAQVS